MYLHLDLSILRLLHLHLQELLLNTNQEDRRDPRALSREQPST